MNRAVVCLALGLAFFFYRNQAAGPSPSPVPVAPTPANVLPGLARFRDQMTSDERAALSDCYAILARAVEANPLDEPVIESTSELMAAHRAGLLFVWRGVLAGKPDKYPGLREELEGIVTAAVGTSDVPLNAGIQRTAAAAFNDISRSIK